MTKYRSTVAGICVTVCLLAAPAVVAAQDRPSGKAKRIAQAMVEDLQRVSGVPGLSAAVWKDGRIVWTGSAGSRDLATGAPITADTRFRLASVSKMFAVVAAAQLAEEGKLDLDAPVATVLPWLDNGWPAMTARHLASHTSGMPHYQAADLGRGSTHYATARDAVAIFSARPLLADPGTRYSYSSWGYTLLGAMIEQASGQHFGTYVTGKVTPGLDIGLDQTGVAGSRASVAYEFANKVAAAAAPHDFSYTWAGGGMMGSARDVARFGGAMLENRIVSRAAFDRMLEPVMLASGTPAGDDGFTVGFGWRSGRDSDGRATAFHNGSAIGARSALVLWREEGVAASLLSNASWTSSIERSAEMLAAPFRNGPASAQAPRCPTATRSYRGIFGTAEIAGSARFRLENGICRGELEAAKPLADYFANAPQPGSATLRIVALSARGEFGRAGLATPYGLYDMRPAGDGSYVSELSGTRRLTISFQP